jgi:hypothetical protein
MRAQLDLLIVIVNYNTRDLFRLLNAIVGEGK